MNFDDFIIAADSPIVLLNKDHSSSSMNDLAHTSSGTSSCFHLSR